MGLSQAVEGDIAFASDRLQFPIWGAGVHVRSHGNQNELHDYDPVLSFLISSVEQAVTQSKVITQHKWWCHEAQWPVMESADDDSIKTDKPPYPSSLYDNTPG